MGSSSDFGQFTPQERRAALVALTQTFLHLKPTHFPKPREGDAKPVGEQQRTFAAACWARKALRDVEAVTQDDRDNQNQATGERRSQW